MDFAEEIKKLKEFNLPKEDFVVVGSGAMAIRGIRNSKDVDVLVVPKLWDELSKEHKAYKNESDVSSIKLDENIEALNYEESIYGNSEVVPFADVIKFADEIDGVKYINLDHLKKVKAWFGREKDLKDIELIDEYLSRK